MQVASTSTLCSRKVSNHCQGGEGGSFLCSLHVRRQLRQWPIPTVLICIKAAANGGSGGEGTFARWFLLTIPSPLQTTHTNVCLCSELSKSAQLSINLLFQACAVLAKYVLFGEFGTYFEIKYNVLKEGQCTCHTDKLLLRPQSFTDCSTATRNRGLDSCYKLYKKRKQLTFTSKVESHSLKCMKLWCCNSWSTSCVAVKGKSTGEG